MTDPTKYVPSNTSPYSLEDLLYLMARLRKPKTGCPWDLKQSYRTIVPSTIEEAYEVADAIEREDFGHLPEELGDLLFQVIFYSQLAREEGRFDFQGIVSALVEKLVRRHPHVFPNGTLASEVGPDAESDDSKGVKQRWEDIKQQERAKKGKHNILDDVPVGLPALTRAQKLQKRASRVGFDWPDCQGVQQKIMEEIGELSQAMTQNDAPSVQDEVGDLLFTVVNLARHLGVDAETALRQANQKFYRRFGTMESALAGKGLAVENVSAEQLDIFWEQAKRSEKNT